MSDESALAEYATRKAQAELEMTPVLVPHYVRSGSLRSKAVYSGKLLIRFAKVGVSENGHAAGLYLNLVHHFLVDTIGLDVIRADESLYEHALAGALRDGLAPVEAAQMAVDLAHWMSSQSALDAMIRSWEQTGASSL